MHICDHTHSQSHSHTSNHFPLVVFQIQETETNFETDKIQCAQNLPCELESLEITPHRLIQLLNRLNQKPSKQLILSKIKILILFLSHELKLAPGIRLANLTCISTIRLIALLHLNQLFFIA